MQRQKPGTPSLLRELNDRAALELLLADGPLTRAQLSERTGVSKVTVSQMLARLEERGLVMIAGEQAGGRGPNAALYAVVPSSAYVAGLYVEQDLVSAAVADVTGRRVADVSVDPNGADDPVGMVRDAIGRACESAGIGFSALSAVVLGSPGVLDPRTGAPRLAVNLPTWHEGVLDALREMLHTPVVIENDVNLAAMAERADGVAAGLDDYAFVWLGTGLGLATVIDGRVRRGVGGAAGEIGWMPVHGAPLPAGNEHPGKAGLQALAAASRCTPWPPSTASAAPRRPTRWPPRSPTWPATRRRRPRRRSSTTSRTASPSASPRSASSSTPASSSSAARSARPAARNSPPAWRPRSPGCAWPAPRSCPPPSPASRFSAAPCRRPSPRRGPPSSPRSAPPPTNPRPVPRRPITGSGPVDHRPITVPARGDLAAT